MKHEYLIVLPWPHKHLSSNARVHWATKARAVKAYRKEAAMAAMERGLHKDPDPNAVLEFSFYPPDRRRRDIQNMPHMMKAAIDGIADAMSVDDHGFTVIWPTKFGSVSQGGVIVHVRGQE